MLSCLGSEKARSKKRTNDSESDGTELIAIFMATVVARLLRFIHSGAVENDEYFFFSFFKLGLCMEEILRLDASVLVFVVCKCLSTGSPDVIPSG